MNEEEQGTHYQTLPHGVVSAFNYFQSEGFPDHGVVSLLSKRSEQISSQHVSSVTWNPRGKTEQEDEDSFFQFNVPHPSSSSCQRNLGRGSGAASFPGISLFSWDFPLSLGLPRSLTPAIWLPGIMDEPCTRCPDRGGMEDCKESLRSSVLICKRAKELWN